MNVTVGEPRQQLAIIRLLQAVHSEDARCEDFFVLHHDSNILAWEYTAACDTRIEVSEYQGIGDWEGVESIYNRS
jgi:hypothetical protein